MPAWIYIKLKYVHEHPYILFDSEKYKTPTEKRLRVEIGGDRSRIVRQIRSRLVYNSRSVDKIRIYILAFYFFE